MTEGLNRVTVEMFADFTKVAELIITKAQNRQQFDGDVILIFLLPYSSHPQWQIGILDSGKTGRNAIIVLDWRLVMFYNEILSIKACTQKNWLNLGESPEYGGGGRRDS